VCVYALRYLWIILYIKAMPFFKNIIDRWHDIFEKFCHFGIFKLFLQIRCQVINEEERWNCDYFNWNISVLIYDTDILQLLTKSS